ncbi:Zinc-finger domain of monoamine-oxidase a repressor r1 [Thalictrum thalictroides]|uniref:Zinc-finger domain of monoamine-oxidase a repressor r1 n=1 Tax=Thalictrum thalictroides TaxID=46969 RepID=A0A7J6USX8_THATH|nr:Zinc-finger domain of monoamine-oxidase a repressor r1 [Thalictrum thalictroides]
MGRLLRSKSNYEDFRNARILENQARLNSLGVHKTLSELHSISSSAKSPKSRVRNYYKKVYDITSLRRSDRLKGTTSSQETTTITTPNHTSSRQSRLNKEGNKERPANAPFVEVKGSEMELISSETWARRCDSKSRGSVYHSVFGICCHFCRQKKLCGEEDCKRCGTLDMDQPCIGKTDCSVCHSTNGVLCRGCLKVRYGEEMEEVRENKDWMCPHCIEEKGVRPYWICNRQKKLCGEEDCKRCGTLDMDQPCIGKTDCSVCHSTNGVLCRGCLKVRYGEEMEEVRENKDWMCPHCIEEKGVRPYWICNSSFCMKKRKMTPTGIAIYRCQEMGYKSVAHLLMDELSRKMNRHGVV